MIKVAIVGFGFMGVTHSLNIIKNSDMKLVAIVDNNPAKIENILIERDGNIATGNLNESDLSGINKYPGLDECLQSEDIDAVCICVHSNLHYSMTKKALLHDKHVFLEKPFCLDINEAEELITLAEERKKILMIGHVVRFMSPYMKLKQWVDSEEYGKLMFLSLSRFCGIPGWGQWKEKDVSITSGGALFDLVIHDIDYALSVLGSPSEIKSTSLPGEYSKNDYVSAMWNYGDKNINVKIEGGFTFHICFPFQAGYMARFEKASILYSTLNGDILRIADNENVSDVPAGDAGEGYYNELAYFAQCVKSGDKPSLCMPESSLESIKLCYNHI